jgi:prefoldin subunit 5
MDLDPILSALSKLEQSIKDRYNDLNDKYNDLNNKITNLDEKVDSILSIANDLHTTSPNYQ